MPRFAFQPSVQGFDAGFRDACHGLNQLARSRIGAVAHAAQVRNALKWFHPLFIIVEPGMVVG